MSHIVIIGGGISGQKLAADLLKKKLDAKITLVTANRFAEFAPAMPYILCHPEQHYKALSSDLTRNQAPELTYKFGVVNKIDTAKKEVILDDEVLQYSLVVVSTGFALPLILPKAGTGLAERKKEVQDVGATLKAASHVVVGGGGVIAMEMAGSIKVAYPGKKVTVVCKALLDQWADADRAIVEGQLQKMSIDVHKTTDRCPSNPLLEACTINGISCDAYIPSFSQGPNTQFLEATDALDTQGRVKVNGFLQSTVCSEMFAVGCSDIPGFTNIPKLQGQWQTVAKNIVAQLRSSPLTQYKELEPQMKHPPLVLLGLGKNGWAHVDFKQLPAPVKLCCCHGKCGFPFCPLPCCWCCCSPCLCGYCCRPPHGNGVPQLMETQQFKFGRKFFEGLGQDMPDQQKMS